MMDMESRQDSIRVRFAEAISTLEPTSAKNEVAHNTDSPNNGYPVRGWNTEAKFGSFELKLNNETYYTGIGTGTGTNKYEIGCPEGIENYHKM